MRLKAIVAALAIIFFSPSVLALSLGEAQAQSNLNQPLKATIRVSAVKYDERDTIRAIIPDAQKFQRAGIRRDDIVDKIKIDIADGSSDDELTIHLHTDERIQEPFLNFLVEVRWLGGSVIREYTLLFEPATVVENRQSGGSQDVSTRPIDDAGSMDGGFEDTDEPPVYSESPTASYSAPVSSSADAGSRTYGPVKRHETLWSIAFSQRRDPGISMDQMQLAIYQANPQAFDGNINQMLTGSMLTIPPDSEIRAIDPGFAKREIARQKSGYQAPAPSYAAKPKPKPKAAAAAPAPAPEPEPVEEIAEPEPLMADGPDMAEAEVEEVQPEMEAENAMETPATGDSDSELPPDRAAMPATAEGQALTQDELMAEDEPSVASEQDLEMPSMWAEGEEAAGTEGPAAAGEAAEAQAASGEVEAEPVVENAPPESGLSLLESVNMTTLLLGVLLILVLGATYWWYRRKRVVNVGAQFAYASDEDAEGEEAAATEQEGAAENVPKSETAKGKTTQVWQDFDEVPPSIDEYAGGGSEEVEEIEARTETVELAAEEVSPIREISSEEIDYLGEADVHLAYGLYDEAASVLQRGINENPGRDDLRLKLLEVYHSANQKAEFVDAAEEWQRAGVQDTQAWGKALQLGQALAPDSALFRQEGETAAPAVAAVVKKPAEAPKSEVPEPEPAPVAEELPPFSTEEDAVRPEPEAVQKAESAKDDALEFDLSNFDFGGAGEAEAPQNTADVATADTEAPSTEADADSADDLSSLDFESLDMAEAEPASDLEEAADSEAGEAAEDLDFDLGDLSLEASEEEPESTISLDGSPEEEGDSLDSLRPAESREESAEEKDLEVALDLGDLETSAGDDDAPAFGDDDGSALIADEPAQDSAGDEEISVKLDLARAYLDMGEPEMARTLLDEVVDMGNEQQRQEARDLISRAG